MFVHHNTDLFSVEHYVIAHGVNCQGVMGSGIAKIIRKKWPEVYDSYIRFCQKISHPSDRLGLIDFTKCKGGPVVVNCFTQEYFGTDGGKYMSYDAVDSCMMRMAYHIENGIYGKVPYVAMPKIGAGLGGGHWPIIKEIIDFRLKNIPVEVYSLE